MKLASREDSDESSTASDDSVFINYDPLANTEDSQDSILDEIDIQPVNSAALQQFRGASKSIEADEFEPDKPDTNKIIEHLPPRSPKKNAESQRNAPRKSVRIMEDLQTCEIPMKIR